MNNIINHGIGQAEFDAIAGFKTNPSWNLIGIEVTEVSPGLAKLKLEVGEQHLNALKICHGGIIAFLADTTMGVAMRTTGPIGVTIEMNVNFIYGAKPGDVLVGEGQVFHRGKRSVVCESKVMNLTTGKLCAASRGTFMLMPKDK